MTKQLKDEIVKILFQDFIPGDEKKEVVELVEQSFDVATLVAKILKKQGCDQFGDDNGDERFFKCKLLDLCEKKAELNTETNLDKVMEIATELCELRKNLMNLLRSEDVIHERDRKMRGGNDDLQL